MDVQGSLQRGTAQDIQLRVNNVLVKDCANSNICDATSGPYPAASNSTIKLDVTAKATNGKTYSSTQQWPVINCTNHWAFVAPTQIPDSLATQTGPNLYQLSDPVLSQTAQNVLIEYANNHNVNIASINTADLLVAAVAEYVSNHMTWTSDGNHNPACINGVHGLNYQPGWDFPIPANYTIRYTGDPRCNCPTDFCGDCEDHAILRAALLRALGFAPECIWDAIDNPVSHEYNIVVYEGAFRIMDYGPISSWLQTHTWSSHTSYFGWNEEHGPRGVAASNHTDLTTEAVNYRLHNKILSNVPNICQQSPDYKNYYRDTCP